MDEVTLFMYTALQKENERLRKLIALYEEALRNAPETLDVHSGCITEFWLDEMKQEKDHE